MKLKSLVLDVEKHTRQRLLQYVEELRELCAVDTGTYHKPGLDELALYLAARMRSLDMEVTIIEREQWGNDVLGVMRGSGHGNLVLLGHMDTVYPVGTAAARPLRIDGNMLYGPGVCDMKGCLLEAIYALESLRALNYHNFGEIRFLCVSDEEISTRHSSDVMEQACRDCDRALVLEAARANGDIVSSRKGTAWYTLKAHGRSAHAGVEPENGRNAVLEMAHQVLQFQSLQGWREGLTINAGVISGGTMANVVPDYAEVCFDLRFLDLQDLVDTEAQWREMMQDQRVPGVELTLEAAKDKKIPMPCTPATLDLAYRAQEVAGWLGFSVEHVATGGSSDASYAVQYGVPVLDGLGPIGGRDHSPDEYLLVNSIAPRTALLAGLIASVGTHDAVRSHRHLLETQATGV
ncbi:MAG: M20 family metallopeptidase [Ktedonobacteraceae bacterium]|nr:M20 family metallopeptidase [Chloroflexota bacterium]